MISLEKLDQIIQGNSGLVFREGWEQRGNKEFVRLGLHHRPDDPVRLEKMFAFWKKELAPSNDTRHHTTA